MNDKDKDVDSLLEIFEEKLKAKAALENQGKGPGFMNDKDKEPKDKCSISSWELEMGGADHKPLKEDKSKDRAAEAKIRGQAEGVSVRNPVDFRYDILDPEFMHMLARVAHYGAEKYGDFNWQKSRLAGNKSPLNHLEYHLNQYRQQLEYDHFDGRHCWHLAAIAFNAMMEFWYSQNCPQNCK
jgi:Domain of unknown function (DUF5664)